jgi:hypothetical protein
MSKKKTTISDLISQQMNKVPTNVKLFGEYLVGDTSDITEKDFKPAELEAMRKKVQQQDAQNVDDEAQLIKRISFLKLKKDQPNRDTVLKDGRMVPKYTDEEFAKYNQSNLEKAQAKLASYDKDRSKVSVSYGEAGGGDEGADALSALKKTFTSPGYNVETSLGHFNARKNKDGTVTITDKYDFLGYGFDKPQNITMSQFFGALARVRNPEQLGTLVARTFIEKSGRKGRKVNIKLPSLIKQAQEQKESKKKSLIQ